MAGKSDRVLYVGTADGLYIAEQDGASFSARLLGLSGLGLMRAAVVVDKDDPNLLFAGTTRSGMFRSSDGGASWQGISEGIIHKDIWSISQHPRTGRLHVGTSPARVAWSDDQGDHWHGCDQLEMLPSTKGWTGPIPPHVSRMKAIALCEDDPSAIFGAIEEGWSVRSLDGGATWTQMSENVDHDSHDIAVMPASPNTIVATGGQGLYRSLDRGDTWSKSTQRFEPYRYTPAPIAFHRSRPRVLLTALSSGGPGEWIHPEGRRAAFVRSEDEGATWQLFANAFPAGTGGVPRGLVADPDQAGVYFTGLTDGSVWISSDGGESFTQILSNLPSVHSLAVSYR